MRMLSAKEVAYEVTKALDAKKGMDIKLLEILLIRSNLISIPFLASSALVTS